MVTRRTIGMEGSKVRTISFVLVGIGLFVQFGISLRTFKPEQA